MLLFHRAWSDNQRTHNQRRERDAATYMQRSWTELKNCSIWLRNSIGDVRLGSEPVSGAEKAPRGERGAGKRSSVLLGEHDGENAQRLLGVGRVFGAKLAREIVVDPMKRDGTESCLS